MSSPTFTPRALVAGSALGWLALASGCARPATGVVAPTPATTASPAGAAGTAAFPAGDTVPYSPAPSHPWPAGYIQEFGTMWTFDAPPLDYWRARYGFTPDQRWLDHVRRSVVRIPGCSASFVSANGLVMTNHHCGRDCTAAVSPPDSNYVGTGFAARTLADEKRCTGFFADQLQSIEDITERVRGAASADAPAERQVAQRDSAIADIERRCGQETGLLCQVVTFYQGGRYSLYRYKRWTDIRLVMAPEGDIAFYGGDPDNFTYPRYDLDLTLLRVYENGQPLRTPDHLAWSAAGAREGDLVFVIGNPGETGRLLTLAQMEYLRDVQFPALLAGYDRRLDIYHRLSARSPQAARAYQNDIFDYENSKKAVTGYLSGLRDSTIMARKQAFEADFRRRVEANPDLRARYGGAWDAIARAEQEMARLEPQLRTRSSYRGSRLLSIAVALVRLPVQGALPDSLRLPQYRGDGLAPIRETVRDTTPVDTAFEHAALATVFAEWEKALPANDALRRAGLADDGGDPDAAAARIVARTRLTDPAVRRALLAGGAAAVDSSRDPILVLARWLEPLNRDVAMRAARADAVISANAADIGKAIFAAYGTRLPPDATFTLRISDGEVRGYPMNGTLAPAHTTFYGLYERAASFGNRPPFRLPSRWVEGRARLDLATPFDFVSTNDIIGGNSGSPVIDRNAEVVGLIFDGNIQSLPNYFIYTEAVARSVSVHSRAITEALRKLYGAARIADELAGR